MVSNKNSSTKFPLFLDLLISNLKKLVLKFFPVIKPCKIETEEERQYSWKSSEDVIDIIEEAKNNNILGINMFDVMTIFDDEEPSLEEIKEAFNVFDENNDGFIDAFELGRVLFNLGFIKDSNHSKCFTMIKAVDSNADGLVDFHDFLKFMETSFF